MKVRSRSDHGSQTGPRQPPCPNYPSPLSRIQDIIEIHGQEIDMRIFTATALAALTLLFATGNYADAAPWRAFYQDSGTNCGFYTLLQWHAALSGTAGIAALNIAVARATTPVMPSHSKSDPPAPHRPS